MTAILKPRPRRLHHDFETFSEADLLKEGTTRYAQHPSTEILMLGYRFDDDDVKQWLPAEGEYIPAEIEDAVLDDRIEKHAWNLPFEWYIWLYVYGIEIPLSSCRDTMVLAMSCSFPGKLAKTCEVLKLPEEYRKKDGHRLINWFSKLRPATKKLPRRRVFWYEKPELWEEYKEYNIWDVKAEHKIYRLLRAYDMPKHEWDLWALDREINNRGIPINMDMCDNIREARDELVATRLDRMKELTGLQNPNSNAQLLPWLQEEGYVFDDMVAGHITRGKEKIEEAVQDGASHWPEVKDLHEVLDLRSQVSKTSIKKFDAIATHIDPDDRLRNCFQFCAAQRTWRWGGRVVQPQNLARPAKGMDGLEWGKLDSGIEFVAGGTQIELAGLLEALNAESMEMLFDRPIDAMSGAVRTVIQAPPGWVFIDADLAAIENIVLGWLADEEKILKVFEEGRDPYIDFASYLYKTPYETLWHEYKVLGDKSKRTISKPGTLGCGYMLGAGNQFENKRTGEIEASGLLGYAWNMYVDLTPEQSKLSVDTWRGTFTKAVEFWWDIQKAAFKTMKTKKPTRCRHVVFDTKGPFLRMRLPSGRNLHYYKPRLEPRMTPWGKWKNSLTYMGLNDKNQWIRIDTHPGKITENADQAISRDLLAGGMVRAASNGIPIVMHVHDQIVGLVREKEAEERLRVLIECMSESPHWAPGLPVKTAGHISKWFIKD